MNTERRITVNSREKRANLYHEFGPGQTLSFPIHTLESDGVLTTNQEEATVDAVKGGGFFGRVLLFKDKPYVVKTSTPDAWHHLWRALNWDRPFPGESDELAVQAEHLATRLIHTALPYVTNNRFSSPNSLGYTELGQGFAHVIEKVSGRGPRFDKDTDEYKAFKEAQRELLNVGTRLGLEQVAQIHPKNPYGLPNIWWNEDRAQWIWVDTIPAFKHTGRVKPWPKKYHFHQDTMDRFGQTEPTFNRIHTQYFRREIERHRHSIPDDVYAQLQSDLDLYKATYEKSQAQPVQRQSIKATIPPLKELAKTTPIKFLDTLGHKWMDPLVTAKRLLTSKDYRKHYVEQIALVGVHEAHDEGLLPDSEYAEVLDDVRSNNTRHKQNFLQRNALRGTLPSYYAALSLGTHAAELQAARHFMGISSMNEVKNLAIDALSLDVVNENTLKALGILTASTIFSSSARYAGTKAIGRVSKRNLDAAAPVSAMPGAGNFLAFAAQVAADHGGKSREVWHWRVRKLINDLTRKHPAGGYSSDLHARVYNHLGKRIENLGNVNKNEELVIFDEKDTTAREQE